MVLPCCKQERVCMYKYYGSKMFEMKYAEKTVKIGCIIRFEIFYLITNYITI